MSIFKLDKRSLWLQVKNGSICFAHRCELQSNQLRRQPDSNRNSPLKKLKRIAKNVPEELKQSEN